MDRAERRELRVLEAFRVGRRGRLHRGHGDHLHEVVDDHVAQRSDGVVEVPAVLDAEALGHRDLHAGDVVAVPHRLDHRVGEPQVEELVGAHLAEEVVDPVELGLVDVLMDFCRERARRREVVPERLLDDDAAGLREAGVGELPDHRSEQERRDLQVEDRRLRVADRALQPLVGGRVREVAADVGEARGKAVEDLGVELLAGALDAFGARAFAAARSSSRRPRRRRSGSRAGRAARGGRASGTSSPSRGRR